VRLPRELVRFLERQRAIVEHMTLLIHPQGRPLVPSFLTDDALVKIERALRTNELEDFRAATSATTRAMDKASVEIEVMLNARLERTS
jgi:hypothetical protein